MGAKEEVLVACDASCLKKAGTGYIIWGNETLGIKHKIISRLLEIEFNSTFMELSTVKAALLLPPDNSKIRLVNDCDMMRNILYHKAQNFTNVKGYKLPHFQLLEDIDNIMTQKKLKVTVVGKSAHPWHELCHRGCLEFREHIQRGLNMYEVYSLDKDFKATLVSRHLSKVKADMAVKERFFYKTNREELRTFVALANKPEHKVKDLQGFVWSIKK